MKSLNDHHDFQSIKLLFAYKSFLKKKITKREINMQIMLDFFFFFGVQSKLIYGIASGGRH